MRMKWLTRRFIRRKAATRPSSAELGVRPIVEGPRMNITTDIVKAIAWLEQHPVVGTAILGSLGYTAISILKSIHRAIINTSPHISPTFWTLGQKFRITAVHKYLPSDGPSGYKQIQHSRPDQWQELISIKSSLCNLRHRVYPKNNEDVLAVIISRNGKENQKVINFNR